MAEIFVFGSNLLGIHKRGAALCALKEHGAVLGNGVGLQGQSYAIPTKITPWKSLDLASINKYVSQFIEYARFTPDLTYLVTPIGCGLAGFIPEQIAPMFFYAQAYPNIKLPLDFLEILGN